MTRAPAIILFDGVCNLCNAWVAFVMQRDRRGLFRFAPLQSESAARLLAGHEIAVTREPQSVMLIEDGCVYQRSTAALRILRGLGGVWGFAAVLLIVPRPIRDVVYAFIARNRYRWFGKRDTCMIPTPEQRARFLE
jgi:predicted DCC family thiol-disulfide oxidoreductase YuxK